MPEARRPQWHDRPISLHVILRRDLQCQLSCKHAHDAVAVRLAQRNSISAIWLSRLESRHDRFCSRLAHACSARASCHCERKVGCMETKQDRGESYESELHARVGNITIRCCPKKQCSPAHQHKVKLRGQQCPIRRNHSQWPRNIFSGSVSSKYDFVRFSTDRLQSTPVFKNRASLRQNAASFSDRQF
jgi:hypothetical protein